ncbi:hypothetical protein HAX54_034694, partial [Datura stramonium]|nr:hypothetical protein [Datura stramonium]
YSKVYYLISKEGGWTAGKGKRVGGAGAGGPADLAGEEGKRQGVCWVWCCPGERKKKEEAARCGSPEMAGKNGEKGKRMGREWRRLVVLFSPAMVAGKMVRWEMKEMERRGKNENGENF